jgi:hypothetical protein
VWVLGSDEGILNGRPLAAAIRQVDHPVVVAANCCAGGACNSRKGSEEACRLGSVGPIHAQHFHWRISIDDESANENVFADAYAEAGRNYPRRGRM